MNMEKLSSRKGARALAIIALTVVALLLLNLLVWLLPATMTQWDLTENGLYSLSGVSRSFLRSLDEDVTVYVVCQKGTASLMPRAVLALYEAASKHVEVKLVDPNADAELLADYGSVAALTNYSMIVVSDRRYSVVDYADCQYYYVEGAGTIPAADYAQLTASAEMLYYYYYYYGIDLSAATPCFSLESALTGAIEYVTAPIIPALHVLDGSAAMGSYLSETVALVQPEYGLLSPDAVASVPDHVAPLLIYAPKQDLTVQTAQKVKDFLAAGGKVMLVTSPENATMPNLMSVVDEFGLSAMDGVLHEGNANQFVDKATQLLPSVNTEHDITYTLAGYGYGVPLMPDAHGIAVGEVLPDGVSVTSLLTTSSSAYTMAEDGSEMAVGSVAVGVAAQNATTGASLFWLSSSEALSDATITSNGTTTATAPYYVMMAMLWQSESYQSKLDAVQPIDVSQPSVLLDAPAVVAFAAVLLLVVPLGVLVPAIVTRVRRTKK